MKAREIKEWLLKFFRPEGHELMVSSGTEKIVFHLFFRNLHIGILSFENGKWTFSYTEDFKG